ncbi:hypothetical protein LguiA_005522 [Lonicera macranthoides]
MGGVEFLPKEYGYVVLVLVVYAFLNFWMGTQVSKARQKYKVEYPTLYALESENKNAKLFNCVQEIWVLGNNGTYHLHNFIWGASSSFVKSEAPAAQLHILFLDS